MAAAGLAAITEASAGRFDLNAQILDNEQAQPESEDEVPLS